MTSFTLCLLGLVCAFAAAEVPDPNEPLCIAVDHESFEAFVAENKLAVIQVHDGQEILTKEFAQAMTRLPEQLPYATVDASLRSNGDLVAKLDRNPEKNAEFFVFRNGLYHSKLPRLRAGASVDTIEEILVFMSAESSSIEEEAEGTETIEDLFPRWSIHRPQDNFVEILTQEEFDREMESESEGDITIVQFFSRMCKYCQKFSFEWHKIANEFSLLDNVKFLRVDGNTIENEPLIEKFEILGFPSIKIFFGGKYDSTYTGERTAEAMRDEIVATLESNNKRRRNSDGTYDMASNIPSLIRNLKRMYDAGQLSEERFLERMSLLQNVAGAHKVTE